MPPGQHPVHPPPSPHAPILPTTTRTWLLHPARVRTASKLPLTFCGSLPPILSPRAAPPNTRTQRETTLLRCAQRCKYYKRIHMFSTLLLTLTIRYLCFLYLHRHDDERCEGKAGTQALVGEADAPSQNYDETGRRGSAAHFLLGKQIDRGAAM